MLLFKYFFFFCEEVVRLSVQGDILLLLSLLPRQRNCWGSSGDPETLISINLRNDRDKERARELAHLFGKTERI